MHIIKADSIKQDASQFYYRPPHIRLVNLVGRLLERLGISPANWSEDSLMAAACKNTGLSDWGDESIREPLRVLLESFRKDAKLNSVGWFAVYKTLTRHLSNRLRIQDEVKRHPEILKQEIHKPLFIVSFPRTGTTLLHRLLAQDPANRSLRCWEALCPVPPPDPQTDEVDPRIAATGEELEKFYKIAPNFHAIHSVGAKEQEECFFLFMNTFTSSDFQVYGEIPTYYKWFIKQDLVPAYIFYRRQLQLLQWRYPTSRWILKAPSHMYGLDALFTVFPDACVLQIHRHPFRTVPSKCSLLANIYGVFSDNLDLSVIGRDYLRHCEILTEKNIKVRDTVDSAQFFDIDYKDLVQDLAGSVRRIYEYFGKQYDAGFEERIRRYIAANPKDKHGVHRYSLEQFGLNREMVNRSFAAYCKRFGIAPD